MKDKYQIIGILSILLSIYGLFFSIYEYLYGPLIYDPHVLYLFMLPRYCFFMADWISFPILLIGGIMIFKYKCIAYYVYNIFFICNIVSFLFDLQTSNNFSRYGLLRIMIFTTTIFGLYYFNKGVIKNELRINKGLTIGTYILIGGIYFLFLMIPIIFF